MTISTDPALPAQGTWKTAAFNYIKWLSMASHEAKYAFENYGLLAAGSYTSMTYAADIKTIVINAAAAFVKGMYVRIADPYDPHSRYMCGFVTDYVLATKTLTVEIDIAKGSGTNAVWVINPISYILTKNRTHSEVFVHTGNGHGTTNTKIRRFLTIGYNLGDDITYADNAANGASFTINENGYYIGAYIDGHNVGSITNFGVSLDTATPLTNIQSLPTAEMLCKVTITGGTDNAAPAKFLRYFPAGSVIRPHTDGVVANNTRSSSNFMIRRVY